MSCQHDLSTLLPFYVAGTLDDAEREAVAAHLAACPDCRADLALWTGVGPAVVRSPGALPPPAAVLASTLAEVRRRRVGPAARAWQLMRAQLPLVRREIWPASAIVMGLGYVLAVLGGDGGRAASAIEALAPLIAAAGVSLVYGPDADPALEMTLATPTSPRQVLLARLALVFGYDLALTLAATVGLLAVVPPSLFGEIVLAWLGPMTFLSALALVLSLCIGTGGAVTVALLLWLGRGVAQGVVELPAAATSASAARWLAVTYEQGWTSPGLLLALAAGLAACALWLVGRQERFIAPFGGR